MYSEAQMDNGSDLGGQTETESAADWRESIPEQYRGWDEVKNSDSPDKLWDQMSNMRSLVGRSIQIPSDDASEADRLAALEKVHQRFPELIRAPDRDDEESINQLFDSLGRPKDATEYQLPELEVPEGINLDEDRTNRIKGMAMEAGLTQKQYEKFMGNLYGEELAVQAKMQESIKESLNTMKGEWGHAYDQNLNMTVRHLEAMGFDDNTIAAVRDGRMPAQNVKAFYSAAVQSGEKPAVAQQGEGSTNAITPAEIHQRMDDVRAKIRQGQLDGSMTAADVQREVAKISKYTEMLDQLDQE
jgi:hypothetical protein